MLEKNEVGNLKFALELLIAKRKYVSFPVKKKKEKKK